MTARLGSYDEINQTDMNRRMANVIRLGTVEELDETGALVRIRSDEFLTDWLPWITTRAGPDRTWWALEVGEQVAVLCPSGEINQGIVLGSIYQDQFPPNGKRKDVHRTTYKDGTVVEYDRALHVLRIKSPNLIKLVVESQISVEGDVYIDGNLQVTGSIRADKPITSQMAVWPPIPVVVPRMSKNTRDQGIEE